MARPTGWDILGLEGDPTPGVVESVQALAKEFGDFAHDAESAYRSLNSFGSDTAALTWVGQTADAFKAQFGPLPGRLRKLYTSYGEASDALSAYAPKLQAAQSKADAALRQAQDVHVDLQHATSSANNAAAELKTAQQSRAVNPDRQAVADAQTAHDTAQTDLADAKARMAALTAQARQAYDDRINAAQECAKALVHAQSDGVHNKHWWQHVGEALSEWGGKIGEIAGDLAPALDVLALATSWIPGVDVVTAGLAEVDNLVALAGTGLEITGEAMQGHFKDALLGAGMLGLAYVGGRALGSVGSDAESGAEGEAGLLDGAAGDEENAVGDAARDADGNGPAHCEDDPIDVVSGQMLASKTDLVLPGVLPVVLRRAYASGYRNGRLFGPGWSSTLDQRLAVNDAGIHLVTDDAQTLHFPVPEAGAEAMPVRGPRLLVVWDRDTDEIRISDPVTGRTSHFPAVHHREEPGHIRDLVAVTDRNGNRFEFVRTEDGTPVAVEHPAYRVAVDSIATVGGPRVTALRLLDGSADGVVVARFDYDERGRLTDVAEGANAPLRYEYDDADRVIAWIDQAGYRYGYEYDATGRVLYTRGAGGYLSGAFTYDTAARTTTHRSSLGRATTYHYDQLGHVTEVGDVLGAVRRYIWDLHGDLLSSTDEVGGSTVYTVDDRGDTVRTTRPDGTATVVSYNDLHQPVRVDAPDGHVWRYEYDGHGNLTRRTDPTGAVTRYFSTAQGAVASVVDALGNTVWYASDAAGLPTSAVDDVGSAWTVSYDAFGRPATVADPLGALTVSTWDVQGRPLSRAFSDGAVQRWEWDGCGNLVAQVDETGRTTRHEYGPFHCETVRIDADGTRHAFEYDSELQLVAVTSPTGSVWRYSYDQLGRLTGEQDFDGRRLSYAHDPAGRLVRRVNGAGQGIDLVRDALGRVVEQRGDDGAVVTVEYDLAGAVAAARTGTDELRFVRDPRGLVTGESVNGYTLAWTVDALGRRLSRTTPSGRVSTWSYDKAGRPTGLAGPDWDMSFTHDAAGRETVRRLSTGAEVASEWDTRGRLVARRVRAGVRSPSNGVQRIGLERTWAYHADGTPATVTDSAHGRQRIEVDAMNRVTGVRASSWRERFAYDTRGNLIHTDDTRAPDADTRGPREFAGGRLRQAGRTSYDYDGQGRLVRRIRRTLSGGRRVWTYRYDAFDQLVEVTLPGGERWHYSYDPLGRRIRKQRVDEDGEPYEATVFVWDGPVIVEQARTVRDGLEATTTTWDYEPNSWTPVTQERRVHGADAPQDVVDARFHAIVTDLVGTPTELIAPDGQIAWRADYTLWGAPLSGGAGMAEDDDDGLRCPLRFPGQYRDEETGLDYNYLRYYDSENGCYTTPDCRGLGPAPNYYAYVDNPQTWTDPFGLAKGKGKGGVGGADDVPGFAKDELAKIKAGSGTPRISSTTGVQEVWTGTHAGTPLTYQRKWGEQPEVLPDASGNGGRRAFPGSPEWEIPGKPDDFRIIGPNQYGEYGFTQTHYRKIVKICP